MRNEGLRPSSIPVHKMPDFDAAIQAYKGILRASNVSPEDVSNTERRILEETTTRRDGNRFINLVAELTRKNT